MNDVQAKPSSHHHDRKPEHEQSAASAQASPTSVEPVAPQDPHAQGAASAHQRELLEKNVSGATQKGEAESARDAQGDEPGGHAGLHSTGSYTGTSGGQ